MVKGELDAATDVEVLQELLYRYQHVRELKKCIQVFEAFVQTIPMIYPVLLEDMLHAKELLRQVEGIKPRDALHAAVMLNRGLETIVSYDQDFDRIPGIRRVEP